jgi:hypothetical protein
MPKPGSISPPARCAACGLCTRDSRDKAGALLSHRARRAHDFLTTPIHPTQNMRYNASAFTRILIVSEHFNPTRRILGR